VTPTFVDYLTSKGLSREDGEKIVADAVRDMTARVVNEMRAQTSAPAVPLYILIPHYDKEPHVSEETLSALGSSVTAGEVASPKKFMYCINSADKLVPVYFSDSRMEQTQADFSVRQTYVACEETTFSAIRFAFNTSADGQETGNGLYAINSQFSSEGFDQVKRAMVDRWGSPQQSSTQRFQNAFGAVFEGERLLWDNDESQMILSQFASTKDRSSLILIHKAGYAEYQKRGKSAPNANAGDL
jgi:hypothetical protein